MQARQRKPEWLKIRVARTPLTKEVEAALGARRLHTVCEEAGCPNIHECWGVHKTATFMILGDICTRRCRFCAVKTGLPGRVDESEPQRVAEAAAELKLRHVVITMVTRDDLPDGGAEILGRTVEAIHDLSPECTTEVLASDMMAKTESIQRIVESSPNINSHNIETVRRLTKLVRSHSDYDRSLEYLKISKRLAPDMITKSSIMLGLGEEHPEVLETMRDLRAAGVDILNLGQYLQPTKTHTPVKRFWSPDEFAQLKTEALELGFRHCESGPFVRSSYHAGEQYDLFKKKGSSE